MAQIRKPPRSNGPASGPGSGEWISGIPVREERSVRKRTFSAVLRTSVREEESGFAGHLRGASTCVREERRKPGRAGLYPPRFARAYRE